MLSAAGALNHTIYIQNLTEKVAPLELKRSLYGVFKRFGNVIDIQARKTYFLRGQAWIIFESVEAAKNAVVQMQGFPLFDKQMKISFASATSDAVAKKEGTYTKRPKRKRKVPPPSLQKAQKEAAAAAIAAAAASAAKSTKAAASGDSKSSGDSTAGDAEGNAASASSGPDDAGADAPPTKAPRIAPAPAPAAPPAINVPPHNVLVATQLPDECSKSMLETLFKQYAGYTSVRFYSVKHAAFIQFVDIPSATLALQGLANFKLSPTAVLRINYANK